MRELTRRLFRGDDDNDVRRRVLLLLPPPPLEVLLLAAADVDRLRFPLRSGVNVSGTTLSILLNLALQHGHLFSVNAHLSMQSKQNLCEHPEMDATSVIEGGASRQIAQVKSSGGCCCLLAPSDDVSDFFAAGCFLAAGFKSISSSVSVSHKSMGEEEDGFVVPRRALRAGDDNAELALVAVVVVVNAPSLPPLLLVVELFPLRDAANRVERR